MMTEKLLLVDDDQALLAGMKRALEKQLVEYGVMAAENGVQAVDLLSKHAVRLVVTDLVMPQMDGFELLAYLMAHYPEIAVVVTTGHTIPEIRRGDIDKTAVAVMQKPFTFSELHATVSRLLNQQADGGTLHDIAPAMFLQLINMERKTCTLRVTDKNSGKSGVCFFNDGRLLDARADGLQGEAAAEEIFSWDQITLVIQNSCRIFEPRINRTLNALILEAARRKDEEIHKASGGDGCAAALNALNERLDRHPDVKSSISEISVDKKWQELLAQFSGVGFFFSYGELKMAGISNGHPQDLVLLPGEAPIGMRVDPKCSKEKVFQVLE